MIRSKYAQVPQDDTETQSSTALLDRGGDPKTHVHCETCDRQRERAEKRKKEQLCCLIAAVTVFLILLSLMGFAFMIVSTVKGR